jgi:hypothetical protein
MTSPGETPIENQFTNNEYIEKHIE